MIKLYLKHFRKIKTKRLPFLNFLCIFVTRKEEFVPAPFQLRLLSVSARVAGSRCRRWSTTRSTSPGSANGSRLRSPRPLSSQSSMETPNHHTLVLLIHLHHYLSLFGYLKFRFRSFLTVSMVRFKINFPKGFSLKVVSKHF